MERRKEGEPSSSCCRRRESCCEGINSYPNVAICIHAPMIHRIPSYHAISSDVSLTNTVSYSEAIVFTQQTVRIRINIRIQTTIKSKRHLHLGRMPTGTGTRCPLRTLAPLFGHLGQMLGMAFDVLQSARAMKRTQLYTH